MRVIAGEARGFPLKAPRGSTTRPTADKIKGAIFSMIESLMMAEGEPSWEGRRVIDLYAGSGALGIEALSRGAEWADFVDNERAVCRTIRDNLVYTKLVLRGRVHCHPVNRVLSEAYRAALRAPYDVVFMDPPYADPKTPDVLARVAQTALVKPGGYVMLEHSRRLELAETYGPLSLVKSRRHGDTVISIFRA